MLKVVLVGATFFNLFFGCGSVYALTLKVLESTHYEVDEEFINDIRISALCLEGDTIISASCAGLWGRFDKNQPWRKLIESGYFEGISWYDVCPKREKWKQIYKPDGIWRTIHSEEIVFFDDLCRCLFRVEMEEGEEIYVRHWNRWHYEERIGADMFERISIQGDIIVSGIYSKDEEQIVIGRADRNNYTKIFKAPARLKPSGDTTLLSYLSIRPILIPIDTTIWLTGFGLGSVYVIDLEGKLLDSIVVSDPDFRLPSRPRSLIQSAAVWKDWMTQWTPITSINYVPSGYVLLQFRIGFEQIGNKSVPLYSTIAFSVDRQKLDLEVDPHWQVAGVQPDGRVIFGHYELEGDKLQIVLNITRIEP